MHASLGVPRHPSRAAQGVRLCHQLPRSSWPRTLLPVPQRGACARTPWPTPRCGPAGAGTHPRCAARALQTTHGWVPCAEPPQQRLASDSQRRPGRQRAMPPQQRRLACETARCLPRTPRWGPVRRRNPAGQPWRTRRRLMRHLTPRRASRGRVCCVCVCVGGARGLPGQVTASLKGCDASAAPRASYADACGGACAMQPCARAAVRATAGRRGPFGVEEGAPAKFGTAKVLRR